jgi:hypothetical protein
MFGPRRPVKEANKTENLSPKLREFIQSKSSPKTQSTYVVIRYVLGENPDPWLERAKTDRQGVEDHLKTFIMKDRDNMASASMRNYMVPCRSSFDHFEISLSWKKILPLMGPVKRVSSDRAPTVEEIRRLLTFSDLRLRVAVLMLVSLGG